MLPTVPLTSCETPTVIHTGPASCCNDTGLDVDPQNASLKEGRSEAEAGKRRAAGSGGGMGSIFGPEFMAKLVGNKTNPCPACSNLPAAWRVMHASLARDTCRSREKSWVNKV